jgi:hypothetical protein
MELSPLADSVAARSPVGIDAVCEDTFKFPPIVVTGSAPPAGGGISRLAVFRPNPTSGGSGGGGFARPSGRAPSVDHSVNCSSEVESRVANARTSIAQVNPFARRNSIWTVLYNSGQRENFIVVDPFISAGVAPVGTCG